MHSVENHVSKTLEFHQPLNIHSEVVKSSEGELVSPHSADVRQYKMRLGKLKKHLAQYYLQLLEKREPDPFFAPELFNAATQVIADSPLDGLERKGIYVGRPKNDQIALRELIRKNIAQSTSSDPQFSFERYIRTDIIKIGLRGIPLLVATGLLTDIGVLNGAFGGACFLSLLGLSCYLGFNRAKLLKQCDNSSSHLHGLDTKKWQREAAKLIGNVIDRVPNEIVEHALENMDIVDGHANLLRPAHKDDLLRAANGNVSAGSDLLRSSDNK